MARWCPFLSPDGISPPKCFKAVSPFQGFFHTGSFIYWLFLFLFWLGLTFLCSFLESSSFSFPFLFLAAVSDLDSLVYLFLLLHFYFIIIPFIFAWSPLFLPELVISLLFLLLNVIRTCFNDLWTWVKNSNMPPVPCMCLSWLTDRCHATMKSYSPNSPLTEDSSACDRLSSDVLPLTYAK